jgi:hypothetical protein
MNVVIVSQDEMQTLLAAQERHELEELRASLRIESLEDAKKRFEIVGLACETMLHMAEDAYVQLDEDEFDDFETAKAKADKINKIERDHDRCIAAWENQLRRLNWEARNAQKTL